MLRFLIATPILVVVHGYLQLHCCLLQLFVPMTIRVGNEIYSAQIKKDFNFFLFFFCIVNLFLKFVCNLVFLSCFVLPCFSFSCTPLFALPLCSYSFCFALLGVFLPFVVHICVYAIVVISNRSFNSRRTLLLGGNPHLNISLSLIFRVLERCGQQGPEGGLMHSKVFRGVKSHTATFQRVRRMSGCPFSHKKKQMKS